MWDTFSFQLLDILAHLRALILLDAASVRFQRDHTCLEQVVLKKHIDVPVFITLRAEIQQLKMDTAIDHVTDFAKIAAYGVMTTPALVVDGKVVSYGKVLKTDEVVNLLKKVRG